MEINYVVGNVRTQLLEVGIIAYMLIRFDLGMTLRRQCHSEPSSPYLNMVHNQFL